jgi:hypothetical protein
MGITSWRKAWALGIAALLAVVAAQAASWRNALAAEAWPGHDPRDARLEALEAELAAIKQRMDQPALAGAGPGPGCSSAGCAQPCDACDGSAGLYAGFNFFFAKPFYKESFQAFTVSTINGAYDLLPFSQDYKATPRLWLGYVGESGLGVRATCWQFDQTGNPLSVVSDATSIANAQIVSVVFPATITALPGQVLSVSNGLQLNTVDLEGTQRMTIGQVSLVGAGGLRYASLQQNYGATVTDNGVPLELLSWRRRFEGVGPTVSAELRRPVGQCGLSLVASGRGSLLFGRKNLTRLYLNPYDQSDPPAPPLLRLHNADEVVGAGQLEVGAQWDRQLAKGGSLFVRASYEGQLWADAGAPTLTFLGFEGFNLTLGFAR